MHEIVKIGLDNEMDLILAHKRTMKLAELCGLNLPSQTAFATAVSEIARCAIGNKHKSYLVLGINSLRMNRKEIAATIFNEFDLSINTEAISYARRLMGDLHTGMLDQMYTIILKQRINFSGTISDSKVESFKHYFKTEPPLSPYDEIRKKNIQLIDLADKLKESEQQYKLLTDTLPMMMFAINHKDEVTYSNLGLKEYNGEQNAPSFLWQSMLHSEDHNAIWSEWEKAKQNKTPFRSQARLKHKDKSTFLWHLISIVPVKNDKGLIISWIGFFVDINAQKQVEETLKNNAELKKAQKDLEQYQYQLEQKIQELNISNHDLEQFAYIASHDLQEPLRKIRTFSALLEDDLVLTEKQRNYFDKINSSSERMSLLIKDVLNYSKISNHEDQFVEVQLEQVLEQVKTDFELLISEKNVRITHTKLPSITGIPLQLNQLFTNLVSNAIKFSSTDPVITITATELTESQAEEIAHLNHRKKYYLLSFQDNGIGFNPKFSKQIFTIFQRLHTKKSYPGTGIGLALCKKIVENHKGFISAESNPGEGARFNIYLPVQE